MANADGTKSGGRKPGSLNKTTTGLKLAILEAVDRAGGAHYDDEPTGTVKYLMDQAEKNGSFLALIGKTLPLTLAGDPSAPLATRLVDEDRVILERYFETKGAK